jgi:hypothetical protein
MKDALASGACDFLDVEVKDEASIGLWANRLIEAILERKWKKMDFDPQKYSWEKVAQWFCEEMNL